MPAPQAIIDLVKTFKRNFDEYKKNDYDETTLRVEFVNKMFIELGWDVYNQQGYSLPYRDVIHEANIKSDKSTKHPDYAFRIGGAPKFYVETKKPSVDLEHDPKPAHQIRSYLWNTQLPIGILTDFEHFIIYDGRNKPSPKDRATVSRLKVYHYSEYPEKWDEIASLFSKEAILKGAFDKYVADDSRKKGTMRVDDVFLEQMEKWRLKLARNIALRNKDLSVRDINFAVHRTIDRIIFLRICEDREIEPENQLMEITSGTDIYAKLSDIFRNADKRYNSGLFHFENEKGRPDNPDELTLKLTIDDKTLKEIIENLYYPNSPFRFNLMPADILGQVYEQFLGYVIRLTPSHQAKVEAKPEVRKAGGVYYTPTYIVEYIVKNTVGRMVEGKTPDDLDTLAILDPACGSGSFLIEAYRFMLDWHLSYYVDNKPERWAKGKSTRIFRGNDNEWRLTTQEKKRILLNNIYGVDIDQQAVEVTKLSLLLKALEDESKETLNFDLFKERVLPDLGDNIKCGNSLIGRDFYDGRDLSLFDDEEQYRINVFDWEDAFPEIFERGGFDVVIGNPPYVNIENLEELNKKYFFKRYRTCKGRTDIYIVFIEKSLMLIKKGAALSFIIPFAFTNQKYGTSLRNMLIEHNYIKEIVDTSNYFVFKKVNVKNIILFVEKTKQSQNTRIRRCTNESDFIKRMFEERSFNQKLFLTLKDSRLETKPVKRLFEIRQKIWTEAEPFENICYVAYGARLNHKTKKIGKAAYINDSCQKGNKPFLEGKNIDRFSFTQAGWLDYRPNEHYNSMFPELFENEKIMFINVVKDRLRFAYDNSGSYNSHTVINCVRKDKLIFVSHTSAQKAVKDLDIDKTVNYSLKYLLGILNSNLINWFFVNFLSESLHFYPNDAKQLPIRTIDFTNPADVKKHNRMVSLVDQMLTAKEEEKSVKSPNDKRMIANKISILDRQIDKLVYDLYDLTEEEIAVVEGKY